MKVIRGSIRDLIHKLVLNICMDLVSGAVGGSFMEVLKVRFFQLNTFPRIPRIREIGKSGMARVNVGMQEHEGL